MYPENWKITKKKLVKRKTKNIEETNSINVVQSFERRTTLIMNHIPNRHNGNTTYIHNMHNISCYLESVPPFKDSA